MANKERTFTDVCEDFVRITDTTYLEYLAFMATCGLFNDERWCEKFAVEDWRQNVWTPDSEEEFIENWIINQRLKGEANE
jgi:hypothetical protein